MILQNLKRNDTNELIYNKETDSQTQRMNLWLPGGKGGGKGQLGSLGLTCKPAIFKPEREKQISHINTYMRNLAQFYR